MICFLGHEAREECPGRNKVPCLGLHWGKGVGAKWRGIKSRNCLLRGHALKDSHGVYGCNSAHKTLTTPTAPQ